MTRRATNGPTSTLAKRIAGPENPAGHAIFFHGLRGSIASTWGDPARSSCWPAWFADDLPGLAVWVVQYNAPATAWLGDPSMPLADQAANLRSRLVLEQALRSGNIGLVGYSLGGLVAKGVLRNSGDQKSDPAALDFHRRIQLLATLGTPHAGAELASIPVLSWAARPSKIARSLRKDDSYLRDLNSYFANWIHPNPERGLAIGETRRDGLLPAIVTQESANPGTPSYVPSAESHSSIVRIDSRDHHIYRALLQAFRPIAEAQMRVSTPTGPISRTGVVGDGSPSSSDPGGAHQAPVITGPAQDSSALTSILVNAASIGGASQSLVDAEIARSLDVLIRGRFLPSFPRSEVAKALADSVANGDLAAGSSTARRDALAWCARVLATEDTVEDGQAALAAAKKLGSSPLVHLAEAFILAVQDRNEGLAKIAGTQTVEARSAAFFIGTRAKPAEEALDWIKQSGLYPLDLDPEARQQYLTLLIIAQRWDAAYAFALKCDPVEVGTPQMLQLAAIARLAFVTPTELRRVILTQVPFHPRNVPIASDEEAMAARTRAIDYFEQFAPLAYGLGCKPEAELATDLSLWLRLRDQSMFQAAKEELLNSKDDPQLLLRRLNLLLDYSVQLDLDAVEREVARQITLSGGKSHIAAAARFSLAFTKESPGEAAAYLRKHRVELEPHLALGALAVAEVELLARAGQADEALRVLATVPRDEIDDDARARVESLVSSLSDPEDAIANQIARYETQPALSTLLALTDQLNNAREWEALRKYAGILFGETRDLTALTLLVRALSELGEFKELAGLLGDNSALRQQSRELRLQWAWTLWRMGRLDEAETALDAEPSADENTRVLRTNLAITSGRWPDLVKTVEDDYARRAELSPNQLLRSAQLAQAVGSLRASDLVQEAASRAEGDASVFTGAYAIASSGGWENSDEVASWLRSAIDLSGADGPMKSVSIEDLLEQQPAWAEGQREIQAKLHAGELPLFAAARLANVTQIDLHLKRAIANQREPDARARPIIPVRLGSLKQRLVAMHRIVLDPSALLTMLALGCLEEIISTVDAVVLPHAMLGWLFQERQKAAFHQPSRVARAQAIRDAVATNKLQVARISHPTPERLVEQVGTELAGLLVEAQADDTLAQAHRVIRALPVAKVGSFSKEEADVSGYTGLLSSCSDVIDALRRSGALSAEELDRATTYLALQEGGAALQNPIPSGSCLYLDGLALTFLDHCGVLEKLPTFGFVIRISQDAIDEQNALLLHDRQASEVSLLIEEARRVLENGIRSGKIKVGPLYRSADVPDASLDHPTMDVLQLASEGDIVLSDDRALSRYDNVQTPDRLVPLASVFAALQFLAESERISAARFQALLSRARQSNFAFLPFEPGELEFQLDKAQFVDGQLVETLELRAIREHLASLRISEYLQMPQEAPWLLGLMASIRQACRQIWASDETDDVCAAKCEWLLELHDLRGWSHRMGFFGKGEELDALYARQTIQFIANVPGDQGARDRSQDWINGTVLPRLRRRYPRIYRELVAAAEALAERGIDVGEAE